MIILEDISFSYRSESPVLQRVSLTLPGGVMTALTGPSGRGKSTLLFIAGLLLKPRSGRVLIDGTDVTTMGDRRRSALRGGRIGFVFQDAALDASQSVLENVIESSHYSGVSRAHARSRALSLLYELGVDVDPRRRPVQISGGQAQRVAVCRALLPAPDAVLADEPTGNLDADSAGAVLRRLRDEAARGAAVAVATHDERVIRTCDVRFDLR